MTHTPTDDGSTGKVTNATFVPFVPIALPDSEWNIDVPESEILCVFHVQKDTTLRDIRGNILAGRVHAAVMKNQSAPTHFSILKHIAII